ncbi:MAG: alpha-2-macroglobulin domain-containing protein [Parcubacteria group bacterium Gr01-1014_29]|nr:MAG: alpha-2-macroglobulin domain-containing protein [Parcubacteria group bacterium Gr01-1014_29]
MDEPTGSDLVEKENGPDLGARIKSLQFSYFSLKAWGVVLGVVAVIAIGGFFVYREFGHPLVKPAYEEMYLLVPDKISHSAAVLVRLPEGIQVLVAQASEKISFNPEIRGEWSQGKNEEYLVFMPSKKLELGKYYSVTLVAADIKIQKDFLADEDPKIVSVFPNNDSETSEYSKITIVFNRPMVPLTMLDELKDKDIPVEIIPLTPGKFKWITTRNLQFIPEKRLQRSSHYAVRIKPGFVSMDGLPVEPFEHKFDTRPLRYEGDNYYSWETGNFLYNQPIRIVFNQPIDIERTAREITVKNASGESIQFIAQYGVRSVYDGESKKYVQYLDKSILEIYNKADRHGREKFWDFDTSYSFTLVQAYPQEGDIHLAQIRSGSVAIGNIISSMTAESERSGFVEPDLFDPEGKLWVEFHEDIDKDSSKISGTNIKEIGYGEKCREPAEGEEVQYGEDCEKVSDFKRIFILFNPKGLKLGQEIPIHFKKIYNKSGLQISAEEITKSIRVFPELVIYKTVPGEGAGGANLTEMKVCTSNPLQVPGEKEFYERVKSNVTVGLWNWHPPYRVRLGDNQSPCAIGQFENTILYGLVPEFNYEITLSVVDDFSQKVNKTIRFRSGKLSEFSRRFSHLQKEYNVTSPERTKFVYAADNLEYVNLHICKVSAETMLRYIEDRPDSKTSPENLACDQVIQKRIDLPKKYWSRVYFETNLKDYVVSPLGHYILTFGHPDYRRVQREWDQKSQRSVDRVGERIYERTYVTVTNLAVQEKKVEWGKGEQETHRELVRNELGKAPRNLYWVTRFGSLAPVEDARVQLYQYTSPAGYDGPSRGVQVVGAVIITGADGVALANAVPDLAAAIVKSGNDSAIVAERVDRLQWASSAEAVQRTYLYTDRPIYRPGHQVFIKGIYRLGYDANYEIFRDKKMEVEIRNSKYEVVSKKSLDVSEYGTFTTDITLDANAPLGTYSVSAPGGMVYFDVEEYVPAAFKVETRSDKEEYIAGDTLKLGVSADYYFGVPVDEGTVEYSMTAQDYYFDRYQDGYFHFGRGWYYSFDGAYGDKFILRGKTLLDRHGKAEISQALDFDKLFKGDEGAKSKIFTVYITAKNKNGQSISTQKSFIIHRGEVYVGVSMDKNFVGKNENMTARMKTVDTKGHPVATGDISVEIKKITWESFKRREVDGNYYYRTEEKKETVKKATVRSDGNGNAGYEFSLGAEGEYEVLVSTRDSRGNTVSATQDVYVYGSGSVTVRPANNETLDLATDKGEASVGENIKIIIKSPFPKAKALVSIERGKIFTYDIINIDRNLTDYNFQVRDEYIPNVYVSVLLLSPRPEIKFGQIAYQINTRERALDIHVQSNKNNYLPGEKVDLDVSVKDKNGNPVSGEISLAVVDMSVLALKGNPKKNPVLFFYNGSPLTVSTESNIKNILFEADIPLGTKGGSGSGSEELAKKKRGVFKDTALWEGIVHTDVSGKAHVSFTLPDNLTTWQVESVGVTKDTKVGVGYKEFQTQKDLMAVPLKPRFIVPGDTFSLGGQIFNNTDAKKRVEVSVTSGTLHFTKDTKDSLTLQPRSNKTVYFPVSVPERMQEGKHMFVLSAKADDLEDTVEDFISITRNDTYESVATAHYTGDAESREYLYLPPNITVDRGGLTVKSSATLAVFLSDALNYLVEYPYGCSEQIASKLSSLAILKRGLQIKNIGDAFTLKEITFEGTTYSLDDVARIGLARLYENQTPEGGFTYYKGMQPNFHLTLHVLNALVDLKNGGYSIEAVRIQNAAAYLERELSQRPELLRSKDSVILTTYALSRVEGFLVSSNLPNRVVAIAEDTKYINEDISNQTLAYLAILLTENYPETLKERVFKQLENRIVIDSRGAYLSLQGRVPMYEYYETPIKDTALMLKAFARDERENNVLDKVLRWILASRSKDGAWGSTNNTVTVIDALTDFLQWKKETESEFNLTVSLDQKPVGEFIFNKGSILKTFEKFIPVADIGLGSIRKVLFSKTNKNANQNNYYYDMSLKYYLPVDKIPPRDEGFSISREFYRVDDTKNTAPVLEAKQGDVLRGHLTITVPEARNLISIEDFIPAGMEIVNLRLATEDQSLGQPEDSNEYRPPIRYPGDGGEGPYGWFRKVGLGGFASILDNIFPGSVGSVAGLKELDDDIYGKDVKSTARFYPDSSESHDDRLFLFKERLQPGVYEYDYYVRALVPGSFHHLPAVVSEMYFPENFGRTRGESFSIIENK